jgi:sulfur dioxygenase
MYLASSVLGKDALRKETPVIVRQLFDAETSTYTYLVADEQSKEAILIDPVHEQVERDLRLLSELGLTLRMILETHIHADHVTSSGTLRERTGAQTVAGIRGAGCADLHLGHGETLRLGGLEVHALETPGHTDDSMSYLIAGHVFTGDTLLIRGSGRTDFQNGSAHQLYDSVTNILFGLPDSTVVFPGHDYKGFTSSTIGEEKLYNPRFAGKSREEFAALMANLQLPTPKKLEQSVPANRRCGMVPMLA